jgi:glycine/D-amino acid oxidase-like deaminating enzyme
VAVLDGPRRHRSLWLHQALGDAPDQPALAGDAAADVCIVGGGLVGLWTAYWLKQRDPACDVVVLEQDVCGGGASGRNGGFVLSWWAKLPTLLKLMSGDDAAGLCRQSQRAVDELGGLCEALGIEADYRRAGWLWTARSRAHLGAWDDTVRAVDAVEPGIFARLPDEEVAHRTGSAAHLAGVLEQRGATVQPARLVRGLRRVCLELGVRIHEHTRVRRFARSGPARVTTTGGAVTADRVVIATNAWAAGIRELHRRIVVISSDMVATAPIPHRLAEIGWTGGECITDSQLMVDYYRTTAEGRIAFGKGGWGIALGGFVPKSFDRNVRRAEAVTDDLHHAYPQLRDVPVEYDWSGPIDRSPDGLPLLGFLAGNERILHGVGWSGNGVGPSVVGGRILAARALGADDEWSRSPLWDRRSARFPPDPVRYVGAHIVREGVRRKELAERRGRTPNRITVALSRLVPAGLEDH